MASKVDEFYIFGCGGLILDSDELEICANKIPDDYKVVSDLIN
jgi:hypothetical protein